MTWNPALGASALARRVGAAEALALLMRLLSGEVSGPELVEGHHRRALADIGNGHARRLMVDPTGVRMAYWPRVWAARAMAYLDDPDAAPGLVRAMQDDHWRVRMTAIQSLGRLGIPGFSPDLIEALNDGHGRVRDAAVVALGRVGDAQALDVLTAMLDEADDAEFRRIDAAIGKIERRRVR